MGTDNNIVCRCKAGSNVIQDDLANDVPRIYAVATNIFPTPPGKEELTKLDFKGNQVILIKYYNGDCNVITWEPSMVMLGIIVFNFKELTQDQRDFITKGFKINPTYDWMVTIIDLLQQKGEKR